MLNIVSGLLDLDGGTEKLALRPGLKLWELVNNTKTKPSTLFKKIYQTVFQLLSKLTKSTFW